MSLCRASGDSSSTARSPRACPRKKPRAVRENICCRVSSLRSERAQISDTWQLRAHSSRAWRCADMGSDPTARDAASHWCRRRSAWRTLSGRAKPSIHFSTLCLPWRAMSRSTRFSGL
eukprot:Amastigsp_a846557_13.p6 type:complete len:118 gc:universal Amastigsp_a846557_13:665-312(-)